MNAFLKSNRFDLWILSAFVVIITFQPYYLYGKINLFEVGLYLPGINALLHGLVPYRDFFHLRGPFELYIPAGMMNIFGVQLSTLSLYFYIGTVLTLIVCVFLGRAIYRTRLVLYLMVIVLVARTFPRVVFSYWGGIRYAFGILTLLFIVRFFKSEKPVWIILAGVASSLGFYTSVEIGVCAGAGVVAGFIVALIFRIQKPGFIVKSLCLYVLGATVVAVPYSVYQVATQSFFPFLESVFYVVINKEATIDTLLVSQVPRNLIEFLQAVFVPTAKNFRQFTPLYFYAALAAYFVYKIRKNKLTKLDCGIVAIAVYGLIMYKAAFRNIWAAQFEMALQPEKILFFFLLEEIYLRLRGRREALAAAIQSLKSAAERRSKEIKIYAIHALVFMFVASSLGYSIDRFNKRFFAFKFLRYRLTGKDTQELIPLKEFPKREMAIERAKGMMVPFDQAAELEAIVDFFKTQTAPGEVVANYPELGTYHFFIDRPFVGKFPIATFSWFHERWHQEYLEDLKRTIPRYLILQNEFPPRWKEVYLHREDNRRRYQEVMDFIAAHYILKTKTPQSLIYIRKGAG